MARRFWPGQDPLGAKLRLFPGRAPNDQTVVRTIVGVVANVRDGLAVTERTRPTVYVPLAQVADAQQERSVAWIIRHRGRSEYDQAAAERAIRSVTGDRPVFDVASLETVGANATVDTTLRATLLTLFSGAALLLAVIGVYGAVVATVRQRWHELGVRLAVGASPARLRHRVIGDALRLVSIGTAAGLLGAFLSSQAVSAFLFDVSPRDPVVFIGVAPVLTMLALVAAWMPANRVVRLDVVDVLRGD